MSTSKKQEFPITDSSLNETQYNNVPKSSRVFISYSHDSNKHKENVFRLSERLCKEGIDCNIDQYETSPPEGWFQWMINQIEEADFVLIVCTENYEKRFKGKDEVGKGRGVKWEGSIITQELYYSEANNKCIPIVFSPEDSEYIPSILKSATYYVLNIEEINDETYDELYARLTDQKFVIKSEIGELRPITPKYCLSSINTQKKEVEIAESNQKPVIGELRKITTESQILDIPKTFTSSSTGMEFVLIPSGEFMMGSMEVAAGKPIHKVTIKNSFYMGIYPVTQKQWTVVMNNNPSHFKGNDLPVEHVSWNDAQEFIKKLNENESTDKYRLPSEAEWEYACRSGTQTKYYFGNDESELRNYAWYYRNSGDRTHPVAQKMPNPWGLYDMHGNILEWVQDSDRSNYVGAPSDGSAWEDGDGSARVVRGGNYRSGDFVCQSAYAELAAAEYGFSTGFRVLREM